MGGQTDSLNVKCQLLDLQRCLYGGENTSLSLNACEAHASHDQFHKGLKGGLACVQLKTEKTAWSR